MDNESINRYIDGGKKKEGAGAEVVVYWEKREVHGKKYYLGNTIESTDTKIITITKATKIIDQHILFSLSLNW